LLRPNSKFTVAALSFRPEGLKAVVFDVDGTLYRQAPLRRAMLFRLFGTYAMRPFEGWRTVRALSAYRHAQEALRDEVTADAAEAQLARACARTDFDRAIVQQCVERWMEREPLPILGRFRHPGLVEFLEACRRQRLQLAALSDYPAGDKLKALGIADFFDHVFCAQSPEIGVFKPNPRGLVVALHHLAVSPADCLYVGDRPEVDAEAAHAAGIASVIVSGSAGKPADRHTTVPGYPQLHALLFGGGEPRRLAAA
jgi:HAD superfamily hydrolase (TIGR01509 family)